MASTLKQAMAQATKLAAKRGDSVFIMHDGDDDPPGSRFWIGSAEWADALFPAHQDAVAVVSPDGSVG